VPTETVFDPTPIIGLHGDVGFFFGFLQLSQRYLGEQNSAYESVVEGRVKSGL